MRELLIVGFGDIARRVEARLPAGVLVRRLSRACGADLDRPETLGAVLGAPDTVLHAAPPPEDGVSDTRTANLLAAFDAALEACAKGGILATPPRRFVYISTTGVYGDCGGERIDESRPVNPETGRACRRVDAERRLAGWCAVRGTVLVVLRAPGIYAAGRLPLERIAAGTPVLAAEDDVYTSHIHADDLAGACLRALEDDAPGGLYNVVDDSELRMGEWFDLVAGRAGLARPPRLARARIAAHVSPVMLSYLSESRRISNARMKEVLGYRLRHATVHEGVPATIAGRAA